MSMSQRFSRRELLMRGGALGASALVAPLLARQGSGLLNGAVRPQATTTTVTYCTDSSLGPLIQPFVTTFNKQFAPLSAQLSLIPTDYETVLETKFAAGAPGIDMVLADPGYANYWYESGWTQALDGLPGLAQINADMSIPSLKPDLISSDGKQMAIPYYNGTVLFAYNKALLSKYDVAPPTTWAEFTAACTKMKKAGLDYPFAAFWDADFGIVFYNFLAHCASEGMTTGFNASTLEPTFDTNPIAISVLEQWQEWFSKGFVAPDILASTYTSVSNLFSAGKAAFSLADNQFVKPWQVTKGTPAYGNTKIALMPGTTHGTMTFMAVYAMTKSTPHREATWEFMKFMAWRDSKQQSQYVVPYGYLVEDFGLTAPYKGLLAEPNVRAAFSFFDYDVFVKQSSLAQAMLFPVDRASWYTGFQTYIGTQLQAAVVGQTTPAKALKAAANYARKQIK